jgi:chemotaxis response regulator CheB
VNKKKGDKKSSTAEHEPAASPPVVALGASAGGLDPLQELFRHMPGDTGMAFMVIQHLSSQGKSMLGDLLQRHTPMKVATVEDMMKVEPNRVYLNPADKHVSVFNGTFHLIDPIKIPGTSFPIDHFSAPLPTIFLKGPYASSSRERAPTALSGSKPSRRPGGWPWSRSRNRRNLTACRRAPYRSSDLRHGHRP